MNSATHAAIGAAVASIFFPRVELMAISALAAQIPDIDSAESAIGVMVWPIANFLETKFSHRGFTHSFLFCVGLIAIAWWICSQYLAVEMAWAFAIGLLSSVIGDCFTKQGVQLFWPIRVWCVVGMNPRKRMRSGSPVEYWVILVCGVLIALSIQLQGLEGLILKLPGNQVDLFSKFPQNCISAKIKARNNVNQEIIEGTFLATSLNTFWRPGQVVDNKFSIIDSKLTVKDYCGIEIINLSFNDEAPNQLLNYAGKYAFVFGQITADESLPNGGNFQGKPIGQTIDEISTAWITGNLRLQIYSKLEYE